MRPPCLYTAAKTAALRALHDLPDAAARDQARRMIAAPILSEHSRGVVDAAREFLDAETDWQTFVRDCYDGLQPYQQRRRAQQVVTGKLPELPRFSWRRLDAEMDFARRILARPIETQSRGRPVAATTPQSRLEGAGVVSGF